MNAFPSAIRFLLPAIAASIPFGASAVTFDWSADPEDSKWQNKNNWLEGGQQASRSPAGGDDANILFGNVALDEAVDVDNLTMGSSSTSATLNVSGNTLTVGGRLRFTGTISGAPDLQTTFLNVEHGAEIAGSQVGAGSVDLDGSLLLSGNTRLESSLTTLRGLNGISTLGSSVFVNSGTLRKVDGGNTFMGRIESAATIEVLQGTLNLPSGGTLGGSATLSSGTRLNVSGAMSVTGFQATGGGFSIVDLSPSQNISSGTLSTNGNDNDILLVRTGLGAVILSGSGNMPIVLQAADFGSATETVTNLGSMVWDDGRILNLSNFNSAQSQGFQIRDYPGFSSQPTVRTGALRNFGTATQTSRTVYLDDGGRIENSSLWVMDGSSVLDATALTGSRGSFQNMGELRVLGPNSSRTEAKLVNSGAGSVVVKGGTFSLQGEGSFIEGVLRTDGGSIVLGGALGDPRNLTYKDTRFEFDSAHTISFQKGEHFLTGACSVSGSASGSLEARATTLVLDAGGSLQAGGDQIFSFGAGGTAPVIQLLGEFRSEVAAEVGSSGHPRFEGSISEFADPGRFVNAAGFLRNFRNRFLLTVVNAEFLNEGTYLANDADVAIEETRVGQNARFHNTGTVTLSGARFTGATVNSVSGRGMFDSSGILESLSSANEILIPFTQTGGQTRVETGSLRFSEPVVISNSTLRSLNSNNATNVSELRFEHHTEMSAPTFIFDKGGQVVCERGTEIDDDPEHLWSGAFTGFGPGRLVLKDGNIRPSGLTFDFQEDSGFDLLGGVLEAGATNSGNFLLDGAEVLGLRNTSSLVFQGGSLSNLENSGTVQWYGGILSGSTGSVGEFAVFAPLDTQNPPELRGRLATPKLSILDFAILDLESGAEIETDLLEFDLGGGGTGQVRSMAAGTQVIAQTLRKEGATSASLTADTVVIIDPIEVNDGSLSITSQSFGGAGESKFRAAVAANAELRFESAALTGGIGDLRVDGLLNLLAEGRIDRVEGSGRLFRHLGNQVHIDTVAARAPDLQPVTLTIDTNDSVNPGRLEVLEPFATAPNRVSFTHEVVLDPFRFNVICPDLSGLLAPGQSTAEFTVLECSRLRLIPSIENPSTEVVINQRPVNGAFLPSRSLMYPVFDSASLAIGVALADPGSAYSAADYLAGGDPTVDTDGDSCPDGFDALHGAPIHETTPLPTPETEELFLNEGEILAGAARIQAAVAAETRRRLRFSLSVPVSIDFDFEASGVSLALERSPNLSGGSWERVTNLLARRNENAVVLVDGDLHDPTVVGSMFYRAVLIGPL